MTKPVRDYAVEFTMPRNDTLGMVDQVHVLCIVEQALKSMTQWEREVFLWQYAGATHRAIADVYDVTRQAVTQACRNAHAKITRISQ